MTNAKQKAKQRATKNPITPSQVCSWDVVTIGCRNQTWELVPLAEGSSWGFMAGKSSTSCPPNECKDDEWLMNIEPPQQCSNTYASTSPQTAGHTQTNTGIRDLAQTLIFWESVNNIASRSIPNPHPPVGGKPYSRAVQNVSSKAIASSSPDCRSWNLKKDYLHKQFPNIFMKLQKA